MKRLLLLRHAKSAWPQGVEDHDRPLGERGLRDAPRMGAYIASAGLVPDLALVSPARRTRETWALVEPALGRACPAHFVPSIYEAEASAILEAVREAPDSAASVIVVGHNPGLETLARLLAAEGEAAALAALGRKYPTGGLAVIDLPADRWRDVAPSSGILRRFMTPKTLPKG